MNKSIDRLKLIFLGIFAAANVGIVVWTVGWAWPEQHCLEAHKWWDGYQRVCAQPILTSDITGRMITDPKSRDAALRAIGRLPPAPAAQAAPATAPKP
jgi:hypothetical protein